MPPMHRTHAPRPELHLWQLPSSRVQACGVVVTLVLCVLVHVVVLVGDVVGVVHVVGVEVAVVVVVLVGVEVGVVVVSVVVGVVVGVVVVGVVVRERVPVVVAVVVVKHRRKRPASQPCTALPRAAAARSHSDRVATVNSCTLLHRMVMPTPVSANTRSALLSARALSGQSPLDSRVSAARRARLASWWQRNGRGDAAGLSSALHMPATLDSTPALPVQPSTPSSVPTKKAP